MENHIYDNKEQIKLAFIHYITNSEDFDNWLNENFDYIRDLDEMAGIIELYSNYDFLKQIKSHFN